MAEELSPLEVSRLMQAMDAQCAITWTSISLIHSKWSAALVAKATTNLVVRALRSLVRPDEETPRVRHRIAILNAQEPDGFLLVVLEEWLSLADADRTGDLLKEIEPLFGDLEERGDELRLRYLRCQLDLALRQAHEERLRVRPSWAPGSPLPGYPVAAYADQVLQDFLDFAKSLNVASFPWCSWDSLEALASAQAYIPLCSDSAIRQFTAGVRSMPESPFSTELLLRTDELWRIRPAAVQCARQSYPSHELHLDAAERAACYVELHPLLLKKVLQILETLELMWCDTTPPCRAFFYQLAQLHREELVSMDAPALAAPLPEYFLREAKRCREKVEDRLGSLTWESVVDRHRAVDLALEYLSIHPNETTQRLPTVRRWLAAEDPEHRWHSRNRLADTLRRLQGRPALRPVVRPWTELVTQLGILSEECES